MKEEVENLSEADKKLCRMLAELGQIEAPKDFEFRVKARIAKANPQAYRTRRAWRFGYVLPATGFAAMLAFAGIYGTYSGGDQTAATNAVTAPSLPQVVSPFSPGDSTLAGGTNENSNTGNLAPSAAPPNVPRTPIENTRFASTEKKEITPAGKRNLDESKVKENAEGSITRTAREDKGITAPGLDPNKKITDVPSNLVREEEFAVDGMFKTLGVETVVEKGVLKIKALSDAAANSGLKYGDEIQTVNGLKVTNGKVKAGRVDLKKIGVKRGAQTVEIDLQAKPQP
jgi:hypothetical protein